MVSARRASSGTRPLLGALLFVSGGLLGCTGPNPYYDRGATVGDGAILDRPPAVSDFGGQTEASDGSHPGEDRVDGSSDAAVGAESGPVTPPDVGSDGGGASDVGTSPADTGTLPPDMGTWSMDVADGGEADAPLPPPDAPVLVDTASSEVGSPPAVCGSDRPDPALIVAARGIAIDTTGIIYFTRESGAQAWVGRRLPDGTLEPSWTTLQVNARPRTMRLDIARRYLYVAGSGSDTLYGVSLGSGTVNLSQAFVPGPHGLAVAEDGGVFVSSSDGHIRRVRFDIGGNVYTVATDAPVFPVASGQRPLGMAFGPSGHLFVGSSNGGIRRLRQQGTTLVEPEDHGNFTGTANDLVADIEGRLYISDHSGTTRRKLVQLPASGIGPVLISEIEGLLAGLAFGRGTLDCRDLYISDVTGVTRRHSLPVPGLNSP